MHQCGFALWNTSLANYTYGISYTQGQIDIVSRFAQSARKYKVGYGFYYQMGENAYVEACNGMLDAS
jgi:alpha-L-fucosidase